MSVRFESSDCNLRGQLMNFYCRPILLETRNTRRIGMGRCTGRPQARQRRRGSGMCPSNGLPSRAAGAACTRTGAPRVFQAALVIASKGQVCAELT